jgi:hypothetical protein
MELRKRGIEESGGSGEIGLTLERNLYEINFYAFSQFSPRCIVLSFAGMRLNSPSLSASGWGIQ